MWFPVIQESIMWLLCVYCFIRNTAHLRIFEIFQEKVCLSKICLCDSKRAFLWLPVLKNYTVCLMVFYGCHTNEDIVLQVLCVHKF